MDESKPDSRPESLDDVLAHFGIPGMKWGHRTTTPSAVAVKETPGKKVKASGGKGQPASADAIATAISKQMAKKSTTDSLSNKELQAMITRMNLEQQYSRLRTDPGGIGKKFVGSLLSSVGKQQATKYVNDSASTKIASVATKKAAKAAQVATGLKLAMG